MTGGSETKNMDYRQRMPTPAETIVIALRSCSVINRKKKCESCPYEYRSTPCESLLFAAADMIEVQAAELKARETK